MWFTRAVVLLYVFQIHIPGSNAKPQASVGSDSTLCQYFSQDRCHEPNIKKDCPNMCRPVQDQGLCQFFTQYRCKEPDIKALCPNTCKPAIVLGEGVILPEDDCDFLKLFNERSACVDTPSSGGAPTGCGSYAAVLKIGERIKDASGDPRFSSLLKDIGGMAALYSSKTDIGPDTHICGAALLSEEFLLTAAHCVIDRQPRSISITIGREDLNDRSDGDQYEIQNIYINPAYRSSINDRIRISYKTNDYGDIALLKTSQKVQFTNNIWPFCLPVKNQELNDFAYAKIAGWGQVNQSSRASVIQRAPVQIVENSRCESLWLQKAPDIYRNTKRFSYPQGLTKQILCAGGDGVDACKGDSGGPLSFQNGKGVNIIMGIIAKGINCPLYPSLPSFYINVANYVDWIHETITIQPTTTSQPTYSNLGLWNASRDGNLAEIKSILATDVDPNWQNQDHIGFTSLHIATENNHPAIMRVLLEAGATKDMRDNSGFTSVFHASNQGHIDAMSTLIDYRANVNIGTNNNFTPLMQSTAKGFFNIVKALIDANGNLSLTNTWGKTALHEAATFNRIEIALLLIQKGADAKKRGNEGETPSDLANYHGYYQLEKILQGFAGNTDIDNAPPESLDRTVNQINTELDLWNAARDGNLASVKTAITKGINPNWKNYNKSGRTSLHIAALNNHPLVISVLLDARAIKDIQDNSGFTSIFIASGRGSKDAVLTLIKYGANVDIGTTSGYTPLMQATGKGYTAIVEALIEATANINMPDKEGDTAFATAAYYNRQNIAQLLFRKGADTKTTGIGGNTPADHARERGFSDLANFIDGLVSGTGK